MWLVLCKLYIEALPPLFKKSFFIFKMADFATLKRTRGGHCAAATRRVTAVSDVFDASPGPDAIKVGQLKRGLQDTIDSL